MNFDKIFPVVFDLAFLAVFYFFDKAIVDFISDFSWLKSLLYIAMYFLFTMTTLLFIKVEFSDLVFKVKYIFNDLFKFVVLMIGLMFPIALVVLLLNTLAADPAQMEYDLINPYNHPDLWHFMHEAKYSEWLFEIVSFVIGTIIVIFMFFPPCFIYSAELNYNADTKNWSLRKALFLLLLFISVVFANYIYRYIFFVGDDLMVAEINKILFWITYGIMCFLALFLTGYPRILLHLKMPSWVNLLSAASVYSFFVYWIMKPWWIITDI